jgi:spore maturation protein CgeB
LKVLVVHPGPHFSVADVHRGLLKGLNQCGVDAREFNLHDRLNFYSLATLEKDSEHVKAFSEDAALEMAAKGLEAALYEWWPDMVIIVSGFFIPPFVWGVLARRPHHVVLWCTESPYEDGKQTQPARYADTVILNDPVNLESFQQHTNPRTFYFPHSYDPDVHCPRPVDPNLASDFAFVGTGFPSRVEFFEQVDWTGLDVLLAGNWQTLSDDSPLLPFLATARDQCLDNADAARLYTSAKVNANLYRKELLEGGTADGWAMGPREVELAACGAFFLREPRGEGDDLFPMLPTFRTPDEFSDLLRWWLAHESERDTAATAARAAVADRTFQNTAARLLRLVDGVGKPVTR